MDTPITPRRSIPTELKPRLRYAGSNGLQARYVWYYPRHRLASKEEIMLIRKLFGRAYSDRVGYVFYVKIPLKLPQA